MNKVHNFGSDYGSEKEFDLKLDGMIGEDMKSSETLNIEETITHNKSVMQSSSKSKRKKITKQFIYELWEGNHSFFCYGNFWTGPAADYTETTVAWILFIGLSTFYYISQYNQISTTVLIVNIVLFGITTMLWFMTACKDPGFIPNANYYSTLNIPFPTELDPKIADGKMKCIGCFVKRPARSSHCSYCNCCVEVFDHHCPYVNNCIGKRNYFYFFCYLISLNAYVYSCIIGLVMSLVNQYSGDIILSLAIITYILLVVISIFGIVLILFLGYHFYMRTVDLTSKEFFRTKPLNAWEQPMGWKDFYRYPFYKNYVPFADEIKYHVIEESEENRINVDIDFNKSQSDRLDTKESNN